MRAPRLRFFTAAVAAGGCLLVSGLFADSRADTTVEVQSRLRTDLKYLASDELEGRGIGTAGLNKAAEYVKHAFQAAGLDVTRVHGGAFQKFGMSLKAELGSPNSLRFVGPNGKVMELKQDVDFQPCSFGGGGKISGDLVFAGYAIESKHQNYDDFKNVDVKGKVVIVIRRVPRQRDSSGSGEGPQGDFARDADLRSKLSNAIGAGASAFILVNDPFSVRNNARETESSLRRAQNHVVEAAEELEAADPKNAESVTAARKRLSETVRRLKRAREQAAKGTNDPLISFGYAGSGNAASIPVVQVTDAACDKVLSQALGTTLAGLEAAIDRDLKPQSAPLKGWKAEGLTTIRRDPSEVKNVIGVLEGTGPHSDETVIIGAHYDHLGRGGLGSLAPGSHEIHNGADDNGSGTVSILELARRFGRRAGTLPRRMVFIAFTGEEEGLVGSAHYIKDPLFPLEKTVAMINLDMVGRLREDNLTVYGVATSNHWKEWLEPAAKKHHLHVIEKPEGLGPSDHQSFYEKKIPVLHFFTGIHPDYHRPTDHWEKINFPGMADVVDVIEDVVNAVVESPQPPGYVEVKGHAIIPRGGSRPYFGSIPDFSSEAPGYVLSGVAAGGPAAQAGIKGGDRIIEFGGRKITGLDDFDLALRRFSAGDEVPVVVVRNGKNLQLKVTLGSPR
jgi:Peptidase family M28/PDZ domain/PA domain